MKHNLFFWIGQGLLYAFFALIIGTFSTSPPYHHLNPDQSLIKLSFSTRSKLASNCHQRSAAELQKLPPNMRAPQDCKRERSPVAVEINLDGVPVYRHVATPSGLSKDGVAAVYHRFPVTSGAHQLSVRVNDDARVTGFIYQVERKVSLTPGQVLVIDFDAEKGEIKLS